MRLRPSTKTGVILRYYVYMGGTSFGFLTPIWIVLLEARGLNFTQITALDSAFFAAVFLAEIPTGYLGDRIGRRNALAIGSAVTAVAAVAFAFAETFTEFFFVYVTWAVAETFRSGNDSAWLYDTLVSYDAEDSYARVRGRSFAVFFGVTAVAAIAGGYLFSLDTTWPFIATGVLYGLAVLVVLTIPEPAVADTHEVLTPRRAWNGIRNLLSRPLRSFVVYVAVIYAIGWSVDLFIQPVTTRAGVTVIQLGVMYAVFTASSGIASNGSGFIEDRIGFSRWLLVAPVLLGVALLVPYVVAIAAIPVFLALRVVLAGTYPLVERHINDHTPSLGRATVLSTASMVISLASIPVKLGSGVLADATTIFTAVATLGALLVVALLAIWLLEEPLREEPGA